MPIFHDIKTIFIRVPKTASASMNKHLLDHVGLSGKLGEKEALVSGPGRYGAMHDSIATAKKLLPRDTYNQYFKFAFIRNPWDWIVSWVFYKRELGLFYFEDFNEWMEGIGRVAESRGGNYWDIKNEFAFYHVSFNNVRLERCGSPHCRANQGHECICLKIGRQRGYVCDERDNIMVDFLGKFENIKEDWNFVASKIGVDNNLAHTNKTDHNHYKKIYTDKTAEIVYNLFRKDIDLFGYKF